jgi:hypothetical protein
MDYTTSMADRLGIVPTDTVELKKRMQANADSVQAEMGRGDRTLRALKKQRPNDPTIPSPRNPIDPMPIFQAQADSLRTARAGIDPDMSPLISALLRKP